MKSKAPTQASGRSFRSYLDEITTLSCGLFVQTGYMINLADNVIQFPLRKFDKEDIGMHETLDKIPAKSSAIPYDH